jgi:ABC-type transport system involved in cytochrome bd biosynthesis fused ATPase/permease subunit
MRQSALDVEAERVVLQNIRHLMRDGILVVITHRDRIAASLDRVIRVREGAVVES